jgi:hypothetical protein
MSQTRERTGRYDARPVPDDVMLEAPAVPGGGGRGGTVLRVSGAVAVLVVGAVHLEQYFAVHFRVVPVIGPLFLLNFIGAMMIGIGLLIPSARLRLLHILLALAGIGLAATSFVFLFVSEHQPLFGFQDHGYRSAIVIALVAEAAASLSLAGYLVTQRGRH